ncbi:MAG: hypothetical protein AAGF47_05400 [Planctomycetota bacterium]
MASCGADEQPTVEEKYIAMIEEAAERRAALEALYPHRRADSGPWYLDALLNGSGTGPNAPDVLDRFDAIVSLPVQHGRHAFELHNLGSRARFHTNEVAAELGSPDDERSMRAFAILESHHDAMYSTGTFAGPATLDDPHHAWLFEQLAEGAVGPDAARRLLETLQDRIVLTAEQEGERWAAAALAANSLYEPWLIETFAKLGQEYKPPGDFSRYRAIANELADTTARSIDAQPEFRLQNAEGHGDLWFEAYSMQAQPRRIREDDTGYGYNATIGYHHAKRAAYRGLMVNLAAVLYRAEHGQWPPSLDALVPRFLDSVPLDPSDGEPLRYQRLDETDEYRLYSVGWDGQDNGGAHSTRANANQSPNERLARETAGFDARLDPWTD